MSCETIHALPNAATPVTALVITIGLGPKELQALPKGLVPRNGQLNAHSFQDLAGFDFSRGPALILSPLVGLGFDALDIAAILAGNGFTGRYRAIADWIAKPEVILAEVARAAPGLDFDLIPVGAGPG